MNAIILDPLSYRVETGSLLAALHVREGSRHADTVLRLADEAERLARPKAIYKIAYIETKGEDFVVAEGHTFTSRVLRVNLDGLHRFFPFVVTSGRELEAWAETQEDMITRFYSDAINQAVLQSAADTFRQRLCELYELTQVSAMNPGSLTDWPLREQRVLFALLGDVTAAIGVELTDSLLMVPTKSVSGILFPTQETFASCQLCPRVDCPNRRAPYVAGLFVRKYAEAGVG
jgi:hypothetical protein